jgi:hypothetical protein
MCHLRWSFRATGADTAKGRVVAGAQFDLGWLVVRHYLAMRNSLRTSFASLSGKMPLVDAQRCITSNWIQCWERYVLPLYGPHG